MSQHRSRLSWSGLGKVFRHAIPGFKPPGSAEPNDPGPSTVCSRDGELLSPPSLPAEPPCPHLCFLLRAGENSQPLTLTQHYCHPGDSQRASLATRDWLLCLRMATSHLMAALNTAGSSGNLQTEPRWDGVGFSCPHWAASGWGWENAWLTRRTRRFQSQCLSSRSHRTSVCLSCSMHVSQPCLSPPLHSSTATTLSSGLAQHSL